MSDRVLLKNARLVLPDSLIENAYLITENGKISDFGDVSNMPTADVNTIDLSGAYLAAGMIDTHVHGGGGSDFMDGTEDAFVNIATHHNSHGVTSMLATTLAGDTRETENTLKVFCDIASKIDNCNLLGVHLEGPYFSLNQKGAQDPKFIKDPDADEAELFLSYGCVKRWSIAPELKGAMELGEKLSESGIIVSAGHTDASFDQMKEAAKNGYTLMTHLYSGMSGVHIADCKRHAGAIEAGLYFDELTVETICDGVHLPDGILKLIYKCKGKDKIILTSDAMRGAGLPENTITKLGSLTNGQDVLIKNGVANRMDMKAFAGSVASGDRLVRTELNATGLPIWDVMRMVTINPAKLLGVYDRKGKIERGYDADLVALSTDIYTKLTMVGGRITYKEN